MIDFVLNDVAHYLIFIVIIETFLNGLRIIDT